VKNISRVALALCLVLSDGAATAQAQTIISLGGEDTSPYGVAVDGSGNVFVANGTAGLALSGQVYQIVASGGYATVKPIGNGMAPPSLLARDSQGNIFITDGSKVQEFLAADGYVAPRTVGSGFLTIYGMALDSHDNLFVTDFASVKEVLAAGGYSTVTTVTTAMVGPQGIAVDARGNLFVSDNYDGTVKEVLAVGGSIPASPTVKTLASGFEGPAGVALDAAGDAFVLENVYSYSDAPNRLYELTAASGYATAVQLTAGLGSATSLAVDGSGDVFVGDPVNNVVKEVVAVSGSIPPSPVIATLAQGFQRPTGVAVDGIGNVYVGDSGNVAVKQILATGGYATVDTLFSGFSSPVAVAVDADGNLFIADAVTNTVSEALAASGYLAVKPLAIGFDSPRGIAVDAADNVYVADFGHRAIKEISASNDYATVTTLGGSIYLPQAIAVDRQGDVFVATGDGAIQELVAVDGAVPASPVINTIGPAFENPQGLAVDSAGNVFVGDPGGYTLTEILAAGGYASVKTLASQIVRPLGVAVDGAGNVFFGDDAAFSIRELLASPIAILASVLPGSRTVELGSTATVFASMINAGQSTLENCSVALPPSETSAGLSLSYQATDPATNALIGTPDTPVTIPGENGVQSFLLSFQGSSAYRNSAVPIGFGCDNAAPATSVAGVNTLALVLSTTPVADIVALASTASHNGVVEVPQGGAAAFAVATSNLGISQSLTVTVNTGTATLPAQATICQTDPASGQCLSAPAASVSVNFASGAAPTFSVFVTATGAIPFAPAASRVYVAFADASSVLHGLTSVAIETL